MNAYTFKGEPETEPRPDWQADSLILEPAAPLKSAERFVEMHHMRAEGRTLQRHGGTFHTYRGDHYAVLPDEGMRAAIYRFLAPARRWTKDEKGQLVLVPFNPTASKVSQFVDALAAHTYLPGEHKMPCWLDGATGPDTREIVPVANGLLHLPTGKLLPHTPRFFAGYALPFPYQPTAPAPEEWLRFLESVWPEDTEARNTLQEIMGLLLTPEKRYQKLFLIVGPKRSGKGTIARVIRALLGEGNVAGPTLSGLTTNFGLQPLIGKPAAIISDARLSGRADTDVIAERLLSITGEDEIDVDRKHLPAWTGALPTRFLILTNELPKIGDASGALASRFVVLTMERSFYGREDHGLTDRLLAELPGILNWAIEGWKRLAARGHFAMPKSSAEAVRDIEALPSPILAFLRTHCEVKPGVAVPCQDLYERWQRWCTAQGRTHAGTTQSFGRDLRAAVPGLRLERPRDGQDRERVYKGLQLRRRPRDEDGDDDPPGGGVVRDEAALVRDGGAENPANPRVVRDGPRISTHIAREEEGCRYSGTPSPHHSLQWSGPRTIADHADQDPAEPLSAPREPCSICGIPVPRSVAECVPAPGGRIAHFACADAREQA